MRYSCAPDLVFARQAGDCGTRSADPLPLGDRDLEVEILGLFADQLPITISALNDAASMKEWGIAAHTLKGSARAVGAWSLATLAETAEKLHHLPDASERRQVVGRLEEAAGEAREYIASLAAAA